MLLCLDEKVSDVILDVTADEAGKCVVCLLVNLDVECNNVDSILVDLIVDGANVDGFDVVLRVDNNDVDGMLVDLIVDDAKVDEFVVGSSDDKTVDCLVDKTEVESNNVDGINVD